MAQITDDAALLEQAGEGVTVWEGPDDEHVYFQTDCGNCDKGLLLAPARFCGACGGSGFATRLVVR